MIKSKNSGLLQHVKFRIPLTVEEHEPCAHAQIRKVKVAQNSRGSLQHRAILNYLIRIKQVPPFFSPFHNNSKNDFSHPPDKVWRATIMGTERESWSTMVVYKEPQRT